MGSWLWSIPGALPGKVEEIATATPFPYNKGWDVREVHGVSKNTLDLQTMIVVRFKESSNVYGLFAFFLGSSAVEQSAVNRWVVGSNPIRGGPIHIFMEARKVSPLLDHTAQKWYNLNPY